MSSRLALSQLALVFALAVPYSATVANEVIDVEIKWSQPLCIVAGKGVILGEDRVSQQPNPDFPRMADDFVGSPLPLIGLRWWGSYIDQQDIIPSNKDTDFELAIYLSQGSHPFSLPVGPPIYTAAFSPFESFEGFDAVGDAVYRYETLLATPFPQQPGVEYFLSLVKTGAPDPAPWGWHDSDAFCTGGPIGDFAATAPQTLGPWTTFTPNVDLAFELFAVIPEPSSLGLLLLSLALVRRSRRHDP